MRIIARFEKTESVRFVSHLDIQRLFQRAFRRAQIPLAYSQGFNPHPILSFATALSVGYTSDAEWLDVKLASDMDKDDFARRVNGTLPEGFRIIEVFSVDERFPSLSAIMAAADYTLQVFDPPADLAPRIETLLSAPIMVEKRTKGGMRTVDIRPMLYDYRYSNGFMRILGCLDAKGSLNIDLFMGALLKQDASAASYRVHRNRIFSNDGVLMPKMPERLS